MAGGKKLKIPSGGQKAATVGVHTTDTHTHTHTHTHTAVSFTRKILQKDGEAAREYLAEGEMLSLGLETGLLLEALWWWA